MSVCPPSAWGNSVPAGRILMKFDIGVFSKICREKNFIKICVEQWALYITANISFLVISLTGLLRMINVLNRSCRGNKSTHFTFNNLFFENCAVYEIMWKNVVPAGQATDDNMAHAHCVLDN
jgi:hypothetical protein